MLVCSSLRDVAEISAHVAQSVEHLLGKEEVDGSIPFVSTMFPQYPLFIFFHFPTLQNYPRF